MIFFGIAKSSLFERGETCAFAHDEHRHARRTLPLPLSLALYADRAISALL